MKELYKNYPVLKTLENDIASACDILENSFRIGGKLLLCGNGGSAADCEHICGELMKGFLLQRELNDDEKCKFKNEMLREKLQYGLPCISLPCNSSVLTATANDTDALLIFAQQVFALGNKNDVLICLSTSGNSKNIVTAAEVAAVKGMQVISFTGVKDSALSKISDLTLKIPDENTYRIQELTVPVYHAICAETEKRFFSQKRSD